MSDTSDMPDFTPQQLQDAKNFYTLIEKHLDKIHIMPVVHLATGMKRIAICIVVTNSEEEETIYPLGVLFGSQDDPQDEYSFGEENDLIVFTKPHWWERFMFWKR